MSFVNDFFFSDGDFSYSDVNSLVIFDEMLVLVLNSYIKLERMH
jgi:hypothetical protein